MGGEGDPLGILQEIELWPCEQVVYAQPRIHPVEWDVWNSRGFWDSNRSLDTGQTIRPSNSQKKKERKKERKRENLPNSELCRPGEPQSENKREQK